MRNAESRRKFFGVTKKSNSIIVKRLSNVDSFIDALSKIKLDLESRIERSTNKGKDGKKISGSFKLRSKFEEVVLSQELQPLISRLANDF